MKRVRRSQEQVIGRIKVSIQILELPTDSLQEGREKIPMYRIYKAFLPSRQRQAMMGKYSQGRRREREGPAR